MRSWKGQSVVDCRILEWQSNEWFYLHRKWGSCAIVFPHKYTRSKRNVRVNCNAFNLPTTIQHLSFKTYTIISWRYKYKPKDEEENVQETTVFAHFFWQIIVNIFFTFFEEKNCQSSEHDVKWIWNIPFLLIPEKWAILLKMLQSVLWKSLTLLQFDH